MAIQVKELLNGLQSTLLNKLQNSRRMIEHPGTKGAVVEYDWIETLRSFLPKRYQVDRAFVIDSKDNLSQQLDIVIYDSQYSPLIFNHNECKYISAESVYAVLEVKQNLSKENILYASEKIQSVHSLYRTSTVIVHAGGDYKPKPLHKMIGGFICSESDWSPSFGKPFIEAIKLARENSTIDIGCSLKDGSFVTEWDGDDPKIQLCNPEDSLMYFLIRLMEKLQKIGTVPAIDLLEYSKLINVKSVT